MHFKARRFRSNVRLARAGDNNPWIKKGEAGKAVRLVQQALIDLGYAMPKSTVKYGAPDGIYGDETKSVVLKYQKDRALAGKDGVVGAETLTFLDIELQNKPWTPLDDLPGESKDDLEKAVKLILNTLGSGHMMSMNFTLSWKQTWTIDPNDPATRITIVERDQKQHQCSATFRQFQKIASAVYSNRVEVALVPLLPVAAMYNPATDMFLIRNLNTADPHSKTLIVHEAAHAVCDLNAKPLNGAFSEAVAFTAQAIYAKHLFGARPIEPDPTLETVMLRAYKVAGQAAGHGSVAQDDLDDLVHAIVKTRAYRNSLDELHRYNGIPGV